MRACVRAQTSVHLLRPCGDKRRSTSARQGRDEDEGTCEFESQEVGGDMRDGKDEVMEGERAQEG